MTSWFTIDVGIGWLLVLGSGVLVLYGRKVSAALLHWQALGLLAPSSRVLAQILRRADLDDGAFFAADDAPASIAATRKDALDRLALRFALRGQQSADFAARIRAGLSDLRFADANRVPFPFARYMREKFDVSVIVERSEGAWLIDADGERSLDVSGSYGVNVAGYEAYKSFIDRGWQLTRDSGVVLGPLHPIVASNVDTLRRISGLDEVSFHMSGTEAVMAAVRLARFNTRRRYVVCFTGAYHGWWDGVQPGVGSERPIEDCISLNEMTPHTLAVIRARAHEIAAVLVNPIQSFHPNSPPPSDAVLLSSEVRSTQAGSEYAKWLQTLAETCRACGVPLILDEVFSGFRLAPGGAQSYFKLRADMVVYGKTVAGGLPIGVVCGKEALMRRFDPEHPMRLAYVAGTFAAHPLTMGAMHAFLEWVSKPATAALYTESDRLFGAWVEDTNAQLASLGIPVQVSRFSSVFTFLFTQPSRYNWLLQYYLRVAGVNLSWVGTGRCMTSLDFRQEDYASLQDRIVLAARQMLADAWWPTEAEHPRRNQLIARRVRFDMLEAALPITRTVKSFYLDVMGRKHDDHVASHSHRVNQFMHLISSSAFLVCYVLIFVDLAMAMWLGLASLFLRQMGHALIEPPCHDKEQLLLGFDTRSKTMIVACYLLIPLIDVLIAQTNREPGWLMVVADQVAIHWFAFTALVILGRVGVLTKRHGVRNALIWFIKLITDPITDVAAYYRSAFPGGRLA